MQMFRCAKQHAKGEAGARRFGRIERHAQNAWFAALCFCARALLHSLRVLTIHDNLSIADIAAIKD